MAKYVLSGQSTVCLEYTVEADSEEEAREMLDRCISEDTSNIIASVQSQANIYVEEE